LSEAFKENRQNFWLKQVFCAEKMKLIKSLELWGSVIDQCRI
jgi:hypothetical protein